MLLNSHPGISKKERIHIGRTSWPSNRWRMKLSTHPHLDQGMRAELRQYFMPDINDLQRLLGRNFVVWKSDISRIFGSGRCRRKRPQLTRVPIWMLRRNGPTFLTVNYRSGNKLLSNYSQRTGKSVDRPVTKKPYRASISAARSPRPDPFRQAFRATSERHLTRRRAHAYPQIAAAPAP